MRKRNTIFFVCHPGYPVEREGPAEHGDAGVAAAYERHRGSRAAAALAATRHTGHAGELQPCYQVPVPQLPT